jgi:hypothetical protein
MITAVVAFWGGRMTSATARERLRAEMRTEFMVHEAINQLLHHKEWTRRSFGIIKYHIRGFADDELRKLLVSAGAVAFDGRKVVDGERIEYWGLRTRNSHLLGYTAVDESTLRTVNDVDKHRGGEAEPVQGTPSSSS